MMDHKHFGRLEQSSLQFACTEPSCTLPICRTVSTYRSESHSPTYSAVALVTFPLASVAGTYSSFSELRAVDLNQSSSIPEFIPRRP